MASSPLHLALTFMCLAATVGVISCGRPHMLLSSAVEGTQAGLAVEELPERLSLPELQWMLRNNELGPVQVDEAPLGRMELMRRDNPVTAKPLNCMNYFWKSRTAC